MQPFFSRSEEPDLGEVEGISRYDAVCDGRSLGPLVKTRALRDDAIVKIQAAPLPNFKERATGRGLAAAPFCLWGDDLFMGDRAGGEQGKTEEGITIHAVGCPGTSRRGDASEAEFVARACRMDFRVCKPWGNIDPYDVVVGMGQGFWRVQVKCAHSQRGAYHASACGNRGPYTKEDTDFVAAHIVDRDIWYIVPVEVLKGVESLYLNPTRIVTGKRPAARLEKYREAWCLLACREKARGWKDVPAVCRCKDLKGMCAVCPLR